jgi:hypothetical protein
MKLVTCLAHFDPSKLPILAQVVKMQKLLCEEVHVCILTDKTVKEDIDLIRSFIPEDTQQFKAEIINLGYDKLPSPWLLTWAHKQIMRERFSDPSYTHFMCIEDDMEVTPTNFNYWIRSREKLKTFTEYNIYPSFLRVEWNRELQQWAATDAVKGDHFSIKQSPRLLLDEGYGFVNLSRTYQGMYLYDRELMHEHINSITFDLDSFVPDWRARIQHKNWPLGLTEAAVLALTNVDVPTGCISRNFIPFYTKYNMIDPCCFVHHLPDKYTNMPDTDQGKALINSLLRD